MKKILLFALALLPAVAVMGQGNVSLMKITMKSGTVNSYDMSLINELSFEELSFADNYKAFPLTIDPTTAYTPDDANDECLNGAGVQGTDGQGIKALFAKDGYFHSCYFKGHHYDEEYYSYVDFEVGKEIQNIAFEIAPRGFNFDWWAGSMPKYVAIYAHNGKEWVKLGEAGGLEEDDWINKKYDAVTGYAPIGVFTAPFKFTKVRFSVIKGAGPELCSGTKEDHNKAYWAAGHLAVFGL